MSKYIKKTTPRLKPTFEDRKCIMCGNMFKPASAVHRYCGNYRKKLGCSYKSFLATKKICSKRNYLEYSESKKKDLMIRSKYKIGYGEYLKMCDKQDNKCAICGMSNIDNTRKVLYIDHDHVSGKIRGLLCHHCNFGLGNFQDSKYLLEQAINYLKENE